MPLVGNLFLYYKYIHKIVKLNKLIKEKTIKRQMERIEEDF